MVQFDRVEKFLFSGEPTGCMALVAGDSNIHRVKRVVDEDPHQERFCTFLPVSGARFVYDKKQFRGQLEDTLKGSRFRSLYLFLGSNDATSTEQVFYRNVTEVCDLVHMCSPDTEIILCQIPPRDKDRRRNGNHIHWQKLRNIQQWIEAANRILEDVSKHTPYVRFLPTFLTVKHLSADGLHLNMEGARKSLTKVTADRRGNETSLTYRYVEEDWPTLSEAPNRNEWSKTSYSAKVVSQKDTESKTSIKQQSAKAVGDKQVEDLDLKPILSADEYPVVIHGTYFDAWENIKEDGIRRLYRTHIHFAKGEAGQKGIISGARLNCEVLIYVDLQKALCDGFQFFERSNGVILCDSEVLPTKYFDRVLRRSDRSPLMFNSIEPDAGKCQLKIGSTDGLEKRTQNNHDHVGKQTQWQKTRNEALAVDFLQISAITVPVDMCGQDKQHILIALGEDVAVQIPTSIIAGAFLRRTEIPFKSLPTPEPLKKPVKRHKRQQKWLLCPECKVVCSREDFLLDHVIKRHVNGNLDSRVVAEGRKRQRRYQKIHSISADISNRGNVSDPTTLTDTGEEADIAGLKLLLSNDVESNPGPTFSCKWSMCMEISHTIGEYNAHIITHTVTETECKWEGCSGFSTTDQSSLEIHVTRHIYDNEELFPTYEEWLAVQPGGIFNPKENLLYCPRHLRANLRMLLFDEDFSIPQTYYSAENHGAYLEFQFVHYPTQFKLDKANFLQKRRALGEDWSIFVGQFESSEESPSTSVNVSNSIVPRAIYSLKSKKYDFIQTTRPELSNSFFSGTHLKRNKPFKRKLSQMEQTDVFDSQWFDIIKSNLTSCRKAIYIQQDVLDKISKFEMLNSKNQAFIAIEKEAAKLAALDKCTAGTFVYSAFKFDHNGEEVFYFRYLESGCFLGFMFQKFLDILREKYHFNDNNCFVHCIYTNEDLEDMKQTANDKNENIKRSRPDKIHKSSITKTLPKHIGELIKIKDSVASSDIVLDSYTVSIWPYKQDTSADHPETPYLEVSSPLCIADVKQHCLNFRIHRDELPKVTSQDIFKKNFPDNQSLLQQSINLNCLSANITREQSNHLYKRSGRFEANFLKSAHQTSSLRNHVLALYLCKNFHKLHSFLIRYFPSLSDPVTDNQMPDLHNETPCAKKRRTKSVKRISVDRSILENKLKHNASNTLASIDDPISLFDTFCFQLLNHGKLSIQMADEAGDIVCLMNDYSATDGSFRETDFVVTSKSVHETGNYFYCTCRTYSTLLHIRDSQCSDEFVVLDYASENSVTCMHCKFLSKCILPALEPDQVNCNSKLNTFIRSACEDQGKEIVELVRNKNTRKFSVFIENEGQPTLVNLTFNRRIGKYIVSCMNGQCLSKKGHKRNIETLADADAVCKHLGVLKNHMEHWRDLKNSQSPDNDSVEEIELLESENDDATVEFLANSSESAINFDEQTGLWHFKCKSSHKPSEKGSESLKMNLQKRDLWNDNSLKRDNTGCLIGPNLFPDMPDNTCGCGAGWLKREDDDNYNQNGKLIHESGRVLTIYTCFSPVKCKVYSRICYSDSNPCKILWVEGSLDSLHVLSRDTGAGDEIGWEFVSLVMNSGCTFSSFCKMKTESYQIRDSRAKFMDSTVFLNWWFSWAANMKIDFRQSCDVCGFEPKRLCCDGTKVGVGFRHANFEEIEKVSSDAPEYPTLHRRMDRCFLKNCTEIPVSQMIENRVMLDYLARESLSDLKPEEILSPADRQRKILMLRQALPREFLRAFDHFYPFDSRSDRHVDEQTAFANVLKMLATTASLTSFLPPKICPELQRLLGPHIDDTTFNSVMNNMRDYVPELRELIAQSLHCNNSVDGKLEDYVSTFLQYLIDESLNMPTNVSEPAVPQPGSYNPAKYGRAYYFNKFGLKLRNVRKFSIDKSSKGNNDHDDAAQDFERCQKLFSKAHVSARGTTSLFLWFCADHGHCYGFHMTYAEGRKDPFASLYSYIESPPTDIFYDFACNLQEYCLNRESDFYKRVRFFHDIFHGYSHKCSCAFRSSRLQGFETVNSEICEQFNSFLQNIKKSARQMTQEHFCFYLQFYLHQWNIRKKYVYQQKIKVALAGLK